MAKVTLRHGTQANLPTSGMIEEGCLYYCTDTGNIYYGASDSNLILLSRNDFYGTCSTAAGNQTKTVDLVNAEGFKLTTGVVVRVKFTNNNTYSATASEPVKLNVNGTGAVAIVAAGTTVQTGTTTTIYGRANYVNSYVYNGSQWVWQGSSADNNSTYTNASLGQGYGTCDTAAATAAKVVTMSGYEKVVGGIVVVQFTNAVPANATMNINGKGAVNIMYHGANITAGVIQAGDMAVFMMGSATSYNLITTDRLAKEAITGLSISGKTITYTKADGSTGTLTTQDTTYSDATQSTHGLMSTTDKTKLDGIATGAEVNQNAFSKIAVSGQTTVEADAKTDTLTLVAGSNVTLTTDATNDKVTIAATDTTYSAGTGLSLSGTTINHSNSVTAGTAGTSSATSGSTLSVPYVIYDAQGHVTASGTHTHTVDGFLPSSGGTITGDLTRKDTRIDASKADNNVTTTLYPTTFNVTDVSNRIITRKEAIVQSNGNISAFWYCRNYDTSGTMVAQKGIKIIVNKAGTATYEVSDGANFRSAIGAGTVTSIATSGTGISGGTITSSGTITLDSSAEGNRAANKVVIAEAAGQINSEKWATTSSGTVKVTTQYNSTDASLDFIFA